MDSAVNKRRRNLLVVALGLVLAAAVVGAWMYYDRTRGGEAAAQPQGKSGNAAKGRGKGGEGGPIPVVASVAELGDIPIYLSGLGTVGPMRRVCGRSRFAGELVGVNFAEGQYVRGGARPARVAPRPFQV